MEGKNIKAVVLSHERGGSYVLCSNGDFRFAKGHTSQSIGAEIEIESKPMGNYFKIVAMAACLALAIVIGVFACLWNLRSNAERYFIYVDINPSVELTFNNQNELETVKPLNNDGVALIEELNLKGTPADVVIALLQEADMKGYLDDQGDCPLVFITITAKNDALSKAIKGAIEAALNDNNLQNIAIVEIDNMDLRSRADELGVPPGKLKLAERLFAYDQSVSIDEIAKMSIKDLALALKDSIAALGHVWSGWVVTLAPTCDNSGIETRVCLNDPSHVETRSIAALGHVWDEGTVVEPTNISDGIRVFTCVHCGETYSVALPQITPDGLSVDAYINRLSGNNNELTIIVTERGIDADGEPSAIIYTATFNVTNNPGDRIYDVGPYEVFVSISGNVITSISIET